MKCRFLLSLAVCSSFALAQSADDLFDMSVEELLDMEISTASKQGRSLMDSSSAVYVLTSDDVLRSGARTIADVLRLVPGMLVQNVDASQWSVSIRGFAAPQANKLLVLIDGRSIYNTVFAGTLWESQDLLLEDIERIEVVRGPGAATWGANAVNGVINIITKDSADTLGSFVEAGGGSNIYGWLAAREGVSFGVDTLRLSGKIERRGAYEDIEGVGANDDWGRGHASFRFDGLADETPYHIYGGVNAASFTRRFLGANKETLEDVSFFDDNKSNLQYLLFQTRTNPGSEDYWDFQTYFWRVSRSSDLGSGDLYRVDLEVERHQNLDIIEDRNTNLVYGLNYRLDWDFFSPDAILLNDPRRDYLHLFDLFFELNHEISDTLSFNLASRVGSYYYTSKTLVQPTARLLWKPTENVSAWTSTSLAYRNPNTLDERLRFGDVGFFASEGGADAIVSFNGSEAAEAEQLIAYEAGVRFNTFDNKILVDFAGFVNRYTDLLVPTPRSVTFGLRPEPIAIVDGVSINEGKAWVWGGEIAVRGSVTSSLDIALTYSNIQTNIDVPEGAIPVFGLENSAFSKHIATSAFQNKIGESSNFDVYLRYVDSLDRGAIPGYLQADVQLILGLSDVFSFKIAGRNLFDNGHVELPDNVSETTAPKNVPRSVFAAISAAF